MMIECNSLEVEQSILGGFFLWGEELREKVGIVEQSDFANERLGDIFQRVKDKIQNTPTTIKIDNILLLSLISPDERAVVVECMQVIVSIHSFDQYISRLKELARKRRLGHKFSIGLFDGDQLVGCAVCGRPVSRYLDDGVTCEINRLCTDGTKNACSMLYGACCRIAKEMGYERIITYILESENGASLKASNFVCDGVAGGTHWTGERNKGQNIPNEMKTRWSKLLNKKGA